MIYPCAVIETPKGGPSSVNALNVKADNEYEAMGKAIMIGKRLFPDSVIQVKVIDPTIPPIEPDTPNIVLK